MGTPLVGNTVLTTTLASDGTMVEVLQVWRPYANLSANTAAESSQWILFASLLFGLLLFTAEQTSRERARVSVRRVGQWIHAVEFSVKKITIE